MRRDCACTFYLVFKEPAYPAWPRSILRLRGQAPHQLYFLQGNLAILQSISVAVNPFLARAPTFSLRRFPRPSHRVKATQHRFRWFRALEVRLGSCELKECFDSARALRRNRPLDDALLRGVGTASHARSTQYTLHLRDCQHRQPPESTAQQKLRNRLAGRTLKNRTVLRTQGPVQRREGLVYRSPPLTQPLTTNFSALNSPSAAPPAARPRPRAPRRGAGIRSEIRTARSPSARPP